MWISVNIGKPAVGFPVLCAIRGFCSGKIEYIVLELNKDLEWVYSHDLKVLSYGFKVECWSKIIEVKAEDLG